MNFLKSAFATFYVLSVFSFAIDSLVHLATDTISLAWIGTSLITFTPCSYFLSLFIYPRPRTQRYLNVVIFPILLGTILTIIGSIDTLTGHTLPLAYAILTICGWTLYEFWFSKINNVSEVIKYGETLPSFTLLNHNKKSVTLSDFSGQTVVILFFRGTWCPFSHSLIEELVTAIDNKNDSIRAIFISSQSRKKTHALAAQFKPDVQFLIDHKNKLAKQLDIEMKFGTPLGLQLLGYYAHSALPTIIMIDPQGKIIYSDIANSYRVYPRPDTYLKLLDQQNNDTNPNNTFERINTTNTQPEAKAT